MSASGKPPPRPGHFAGVGLRLIRIEMVGRRIAVRLYRPTDPTAANQCFSFVRTTMGWQPYSSADHMRGCSTTFDAPGSVDTDHHDREANNESQKRRDYRLRQYRNRPDVQAAAV